MLNKTLASLPLPLPVPLAPSNPTRISCVYADLMAVHQNMVAVVSEDFGIQIGTSAEYRANTPKNILQRDDLDGAALAFSQSGKHLALVTYGGQLLIFDRDGECLRTVPVGDPGPTIGISPIPTSGGLDWIVLRPDSVWRVSGDVGIPLQLGTRILGGCLHPDGRLAVVDDVLNVHLVGVGERLAIDHSILLNDTGGKGATLAAMSQTHIALADKSDGKIAIHRYDVEDLNKTIPQFLIQLHPRMGESSAGISALSFVADARYLLASRREGEGVFCDVEQGCVVAQFDFEPDLGQGEMRFPPRVVVGDDPSRLLYACQNSIWEMQLFEGV